MLDERQDGEAKFNPERNLVEASLEVWVDEAGSFSLGWSRITLVRSYFFAMDSRSWFVVIFGIIGSILFIFSFPTVKGSDGRAA